MAEITISKLPSKRCVYIKSYSVGLLILSLICGTILIFCKEKKKKLINVGRIFSPFSSFPLQFIFAILYNCV